MALILQHGAPIVGNEIFHPSKPYSNGTLIVMGYSQE